jgi:hypothetical protein
LEAWLVNLYITLDDNYVQWVSFAALFVMILTTLCSVFYIDRSSEANLVPVCVCVCVCVHVWLMVLKIVFLLLLFDFLIMPSLVGMDIAQINKESCGI